MTLIGGMAASSGPSKVSTGATVGTRSEGSTSTSSPGWTPAARSVTSQAAAERRSQVRTVDRSQRVRTYNFPENRLTDHRVHLTVHRLDKILEGELDEFTEALAAEDRRRALETSTA